MPINCSGHESAQGRVRPCGTVDRDKPVAPMNWMQRLKRIFAIDIETCPDCGGTLRVIACIEDPPLIAKILGHVLYSYYQREESRNCSALVAGFMQKNPKNEVKVPRSSSGS